MRNKVHADGGNPLLHAIFGQQFEDIVTHQDTSRQTPDANLPMNVLWHVRDYSFLAVTELCCGLFRFAFVSFFAGFFQTESHSFRLSLRATGA